MVWWNFGYYFSLDFDSFAVVFLYEFKLYCLGRRRSRFLESGIARLSGKNTNSSNCFPVLVSNQGDIAYFKGWWWGCIISEPNPSPPTHTTWSAACYQNIAFEFRKNDWSGVVFDPDFEVIFKMSPADGLWAWNQFITCPHPSPYRMPVPGKRTSTGLFTYFRQRYIFLYGPVESELFSCVIFICAAFNRDSQICKWDSILWCFSSDTNVIKTERPSIG